MNIDKENNVAYVEGKAYRLVPIEQEKIFICEINGKRYYLGPEAKKKMNWNDAKKWAKDVGGVLMPRDVAIVACEEKEVRKHFRKDVRYWTSTEHDPAHAWGLYFGFVYSLPDYYYKLDALYVRAVFVE